MTRLQNAYAWLADPNGAALYATASALRTISELLADATAAEVRLAEPPPAIAESRPIHTVEVSAGEGPLRISADADRIAITGGLPERKMLSATLENLALEPLGRGPIARHVDLEYFPGHAFLSADSLWMTIFLLPDSG